MFRGKINKEQRVEQMSRKAFDALPLYQTSMPTGVISGRKWKRCYINGWYMGEFQQHSTKPDVCLEMWSKIVVTGGPQPPDGRYHFQKIAHKYQDCSLFKECDCPLIPYKA